MTDSETIATDYTLHPSELAATRICSARPPSSAGPRPELPKFWVRFENSGRWRRLT